MGRGRSKLGSGRSKSASNIVRQYDITDFFGSRSDIMDFYQDIYDNGGLDMDDDGNLITSPIVLEKAQDLADTLAGRIMESDPDAERELAAVMETMPDALSISARDRSNIPDFRANSNVVKISRNGVPVDTVYEELAGRFPGLFDARSNTNPADQLMDINRVVRQLRNSRRPLNRYDRRQAAQSMYQDILYGYFDDQDFWGAA